MGAFVGIFWFSQRINHGSKLTTDVNCSLQFTELEKGCPQNFEFQNYTIITSQCKGPRYPPKLCCDAFKRFACPYAAYINDLASECASVMFSYINLYGKYPPGLFASECREGKAGLDCTGFLDDATFDPPTTSKSEGCIPGSLSPFLIAAICFILLPQIFERLS
ncbi:hypothetical protein IFM89_012700 [Coptis chinensis]|uniref:GPI-anchored protein LLG1-like domain-containing protein n=1 Tax=Coptis chinensis TaxID=261450 RepID=A0A835MF02_9MAGN|nr:hypothetical protein IFM89_012700 [Coptis chinensis]